VSKHKQTKPSAQTKPSGPTPAKRRVFGPAFTVSLIAAALVVGHRLQGERSKRRQPPVVEHRVVSGDHAPSRFAPEITVLLEESADLDLAADQQRKLETLAREWKQAAGPLKEDLDRGTKRFREYADQAVGGGKGDLAEFQRRAEPALELGRELADLKLQFWQRAMKVLTPSQRERAEELRKNTLTPEKERK
jgi:hypothetical protein